MDNLAKSLQDNSYFLKTYGFKIVRCELISNTDCLIYRLRYVQKGQEFDAALRIFPNEAKRVDVDAEVSWLITLSQEKDFLSPTVIAAKDGSTVQTIQTAPDEPAKLAIVVSWLDGLRIEDSVTEPQVGKVGRMLGLMHKRSQNELTPDRIKSKRPAFEIYASDFGLLKEISDDAEAVLQSTAQIVQEELKTDVRTNDDHGFLHGDLHGHNLLMCGDDIGVIDFSDCGWGEYGYDVATPLFYFTQMPAWDDDNDKSDHYARLAHTFLREYESIKPLPAEFEKRLPLYYAARIFVTTQWIVEDLKDLDKTDWSRTFLQNAVPRLREFVKAH